MILSTKLLRPVPENQVWACTAEGCNSPAEYHNAAATEGEAYCAEHTMLEDLDPNWPSNRDLLDRQSVSRQATFPDIEKFSDLFRPRPSGEDRGKVGVWISLPTACGLRGNSADAKDRLLDHIRERTIFGEESRNSLDKFYYIQIVQRGDLAYIYLKFQQITGSHFMGIVTWESLKEFFVEHKK